MTGYDLSRQWFDFAFETSECKVHHTALYLWIVELNNRLGWKKEFGLPTSATMEGLGIGNRGTFSKTLEDLQKWGFIEVVQSSKNQFQSCRISLCLFKSEQAEHQALDQALYRHSIKHCTDTDTDTASSTVHIDKPLNIETFKPINQETDVDADRVIEVEEVKVEEKKATPSKVAQKDSPSLHGQLREIIETANPGYYWQAKDGRALKSLIAKIRFRMNAKNKEDPTDEQIIASFNWMIKVLPPWFQDKWDTAMLESHFESIVKQITEAKNGKSAATGRVNSQGDFDADRVQGVLERINARHSGSPQG